MRLLPKAVEELIERFGELPGVGPRTAERLTFFVLRTDPALALRLGEALTGVHQRLSVCATCHNFAESPQCDVCANSGRQRHIVAVVEEPLDVVALEKTGLYQGLYHVLGGAISPMDGVGPDNLHIASLVARVKNEGISEVILATNPSTEGETTALYIRQQLENTPVSVTRLARGLPVGGDLEYADQVTLGRALQGRQSC